MLPRSPPSWQFPILITALYIVPSTLKMFTLQDVPAKIIFGWKYQIPKITDRWQFIALSHRSPEVGCPRQFHKHSTPGSFQTLLLHSLVRPSSARSNMITGAPAVTSTSSEQEEDMKKRSQRGHGGQIRISVALTKQFLLHSIVQP